MTARAVTDVDLLVINGRLISQLIESNPQFAQELNLFIEKRQMRWNWNRNEGKRVREQKGWRSR
ncbi:hypothetical protein C2W62_53950 [Candidatus Entotheonella serta]|nr:hypothetical protein C2W62_53950 [Candidatus Entotheonella serta]